MKAAKLGVRISLKQLFGQRKRIRNTLTYDILEATGLAVKEN
jgi:hypothetical protein